MGINRDTYIARISGAGRLETLPAECEVRYLELEINKALLDAADFILFSSEPYRFLPEDLEGFARDYDCPAEKLRLIDVEMTSWYGSRAIQGLRYMGQLAREISASAR
ncbi:MAG: hypothetical protein R3F40_02190 [Candidatus Competibacteraceae bacterium]